MMPTERSVPAMTKRPARNSMSAAAASSTCAAICLPASMTLSAGLDDRVAADDHRFRAAGAAAGDQLVAVALQQADALERDAEPGRRAPGRRARQCPWP